MALKSFLENADIFVLELECVQHRNYMAWLFLICLFCKIKPKTKSMKLSLSLYNDQNGWRIYQLFSLKTFCLCFMTLKLLFYSIYFLSSNKERIYKHYQIFLKLDEKLHEHSAEKFILLFYISISIQYYVSFRKGFKDKLFRYIWPQNASLSFTVLMLVFKNRKDVFFQ